MILLLLSLIKLYTEEKIGLTPVPAKRKWLVQAPFSLYLGWISVATIANVSVVLYDLKWGGFGISPLTWTLIMMSAAVILATIMLIRRRDYIFALVIIWALIGIGVKHSDLNPIKYMAVIGVCWLLAASVYQFIFPAPTRQPARRQSPPSN